MSVRLLLLLGIMLFSGTVRTQALTFDPAHVAVFFANPYPLSPIKSLRGLVMALWSEAEEAVQSPEATALWRDYHQSLFVERLLDASTVVDLLCVQGHQYEEEIKMLLQALNTLEKQVYQLTDGLRTDDVACMKIVLDRIKKKMEQI